MKRHEHSPGEAAGDKKPKLDDHNGNGLSMSHNHHTCKPMIGPSLLASDLSRLAEESKRVIDGGADYLHLDVMDGHFVPNITIGAPVIKCLRKNSQAFFDCHMMVAKPEQWVGDIADAGAEQYTFHFEATSNPLGVIRQVKEAGMKCGLAVKPKTDVSAVEEYVDEVDMILVMTVEPGFGGQKFMADMMPKVSHLRGKYPTLNIEVDGGLGDATIEAAATAGANWIVAGSSVFNAEDPSVAIERLRKGVLRYGHGLDV